MLKNKIKKYEEKYNYSREKIAEKRKAVKSIKNATTEYLVVFELKESEEIAETIDPILLEGIIELKNKNMITEIQMNKTLLKLASKENKILLNSFYFTNLKNIMEIKTNNQ